MKIMSAAALFFSLCPAVMGAEIGITVVTQSRAGRAAGDVPGAVEVITGGQLESAPGVTLNDKLVDLIPGAVSSRANGIYSFTSAVTLRGSGSVKRLNVANPGLKPEVVDTAETGLKLEPLTGLYVEPAVYYTTGRNFMYTTDTGELIGGVKVSKKENIARVAIYGAELPVKYYAGAFSFAAAYAWSDSEIESYGGTAALEGRTLTYAPRQTVAANAGLKTAPADFTLGWVYKSKQFTADDNSAWVKEYYTFSASASRAFTSAVTAKVSVDNIFDKRYQESSSDLAPGRTVTVSMEAKF